jgi:hypothetical protein
MDPGTRGGTETATYRDILSTAAKTSAVIQKKFCGHAIQAHTASSYMVWTEPCPDENAGKASTTREVTKGREIM